MRSLYEILGVDSDATTEQIKKQYRKLSREHHPDHGGDADIFAEIAEAYSVLKDEGKREYYDATGSMISSDDPFAEVYPMLAKLLPEALLQEQKDPLDYIRDRIDKEREGVRAQILKGEKCLKILERRDKTFKKKNKKKKDTSGYDFMVEGFQFGIGQTKKGLEELNHAAELGTKMLELIDGLQCPLTEEELKHVDKRSSPSFDDVMSQIMGMGVKYGFRTTET